MPDNIFINYDPSPSPVTSPEKTPYHEGDSAKDENGLITIHLPKAEPVKLALSSSALFRMLDERIKANYKSEAQKNLVREYNRFKQG